MSPSRPLYLCQMSSLNFHLLENNKCSLSYYLDPALFKRQTCLFVGQEKLVAVTMHILFQLIPSLHFFVSFSVIQKTIASGEKQWPENIKDVS